MRWGAGRLPYKTLVWAEQLCMILTSSDPGSRTLTALASLSVTGCTNRAFPGVKDKHGNEWLLWFSKLRLITAAALCSGVALSTSQSHFKGLLEAGMCLCSLCTEKKRHVWGARDCSVSFCYGTIMQLGCIAHSPTPAYLAYTHFPHQKFLISLETLPREACRKTDSGIQLVSLLPPPCSRPSGIFRFHFFHSPYSYQELKIK